MSEVEAVALEIAVDERYSRFHRRDASVTWWDYYGGRWMVAGYQQVMEAARNTEVFSSRHDLPNGSSSYEGVMVPATPVRAVPIEMDPPSYAAYRQIVAPRFSPAAVRRLSPRIDEFVTACVDRRIESGRMDLFHDLAKLVPAMTTMEVLGLPLGDALVIADAVHRRGEDRFAMNYAWTLLMQRTLQSLEERRRERRDDLISQLLDAELNGRRFEDHEIMEICFTMVIGGMATTARLALGALSYLAGRPAERLRLLGEPGLLDSAIEEFLRYYSPVPFLSRTATQDTCLGGQDIKAGERVALGYAAANRDPAVFVNPDEIILDRSPNRHVALGHGVHYCLGANLGRLEAARMVAEVLRRLPDYELMVDADPESGAAGCPFAVPKDGVRAGDPWEVRTDRGLPVRFSPGQRSGLTFDDGIVALLAE